MTFDQWIAVASSMGTVLAAVIAAAGIVEIRRQARTQFRPQIVLEGAIFQISLDQAGWWWEPPTEDKLRPIGSTDYRFPILNVGNGTAVDLSIKWSLDVEGMISVINQLSSKRKLRVRVEKNEYWINFLENGKIVSGVRPEPYEEHRNYILPVAQKDRDTRVEVPPIWRSMLLIYYSALLEPGTWIHERVRATRVLPSAGTAAVRYKDTTGRSYCKSFHVSPQLTFLDEEESRTMQLAFTVTDV